MAEYDSLPWDNGPVTPPSYAGKVTERKCRRHQWGTAIIDGQSVKVCRVPGCARQFEAQVVRRNRNNRARGKGTSKDLADYLGWQNVEGLNLPWDIQNNAGRLQSKRDLNARTANAALLLIDYIPAGDWLRGLFWVAPRARLTSGDVTMRLEEWVQWHSWLLPPNAVLLRSTTGVPMVRMPLPVFRDTHV